jgi:methylmalonyl-CoA mutase N-terminal domain/subunit
VQGQIQEAAYKYQRSIESKERIIVGVNEFDLTKKNRSEFGSGPGTGSGAG